MPLRRVGLAMFFFVHGVVYWLINRFGYIFVPMHEVLQVSIAVVIIIILMIDGIGWSDDRTKFSSAVNALLPMIALFFVGTITNGGFLYLLLFIVALVCSVVLFFVCTHSRKVKIVLGVIYSIVLAVPMLFFVLALIGALLPQFGHTEVRQAELSPGGIYLAEVVENSQGALGGNTWIYVTPQGKTINILVGELRPSPQNIFSGRWSGSQYMVPHWKTDEVLYIIHIDDPAHVIMRFQRQGNDWVRLHD